MKRSLVVSLLFLMAWANSPAQRASVQDPYLVVLSLDGFRWDYPDLYHTPNLDKIARKGVKAESLMPSYPTKTFPNHYSIATGLYPDHHGIVQNSFYDPRTDKTFRMGDRAAVRDSSFWEGEAIWETAARQGVLCASYFWVGSESDEYFKPAYRKNYESGFPYAQQVDTIMHWLSLPSENRPKLVMFYFDEPDKTSHDEGPAGDSTRVVVEQLDRLLGQLVKRLDRIERKGKLCINLIILSDHGMGNIPEGNQVFLEDLIDLKKIKRINGGNPVITLEPEPAYADEAYRLLKQASHLKVFKKTEMPARYHYGTHPRIPELIVEADSAYGLEIRRKQGLSYTRGTHGYDPANRDMHGIFYAMGPAFKSGWVQPTFENVSIYNLMAYLLGVKPAPNDGTFSSVSGMLRGH